MGAKFTVHVANKCIFVHGVISTTKSLLLVFCHFVAPFQMHMCSYNRKSLVVWVLIFYNSKESVKEATRNMYEKGGNYPGWLNF